MQTLMQTETHRHTDTQTHRHTDTQTHRHTDTQTHRHTGTQAHRHTDTQTHRHFRRIKGELTDLKDQKREIKAFVNHGAPDISDVVFVLTLSVSDPSLCREGVFMLVSYSDIDDTENRISHTNAGRFYFLELLSELLGRPSL